MMMLFRDGSELKKEGRPPRCEDCVWFEQCGSDEACELYDPVEGDGEEDYLSDLRMRQEAYDEQLDEQND